MNRNWMSYSASPFLRMSYETSVKFITNAALHCEIDNCKSPSSRIILGQNPNLGTGMCDILMDSGLWFIQFMLYQLIWAHMRDKILNWQQNHAFIHSALTFSFPTSYPFLFSISKFKFRQSTESTSGVKLALNYQTLTLQPQKHLHLLICRRRRWWIRNIFASIHHWTRHQLSLAPSNGNPIAGKGLFQVHWRSLNFGQWNKQKP